MTPDPILTLSRRCAGDSSILRVNTLHEAGNRVYIWPVGILRPFGVRRLEVVGETFAGIGDRHILFLQRQRARSHVQEEGLSWAISEPSLGRL